MGMVLRDGTFRKSSDTLECDCSSTTTSLGYHYYQILFGAEQVRVTLTVQLQLELSGSGDHTQVAEPLTYEKVTYDVAGARAAPVGCQSAAGQLEGEGVVQAAVMLRETE